MSFSSSLISKEKLRNFTVSNNNFFYKITLLNLRFRLPSFHFHRSNNFFGIFIKRILQRVI